MNLCRIPGCKGKIVPREKGSHGKHHNCCSKHLPHFRRVSIFKRDIHRVIAFGEYKRLEDIRCRGCKVTLLTHWNRHCSHLYRDIELTKKEKLDIVYKLFQVDHINGREKGKDYNSIDNLQILCSNCHDAKSIFSGDNDSHRYKR